MNSAQSHDRHQPGQVKTNTCVLWDTSIHHPDLSKLLSQGDVTLWRMCYLPSSAYSKWAHRCSVSVIDRREIMLLPPWEHGQFSSFVQPLIILSICSCSFWVCLQFCCEIVLLILLCSFFFPELYFVFRAYSGFPNDSLCPPKELKIVKLLKDANLITSLSPTNQNQEGGGIYNINTINNGDPGCHSQPSYLWCNTDRFAWSISEIKSVDGCDFFPLILLNFLN